MPVRQTKLGIGWDDSNFTYFSPDSKKTKNHYLDFSIPYCKQFLNWKLYFNPLYPELGPDLIIDDDEFLQDERVQNLAHRLPSLVNWNPAKNTSLLRVLYDLVQLYKHHQLKLFNEHSEKLTREYNMLMSKMDSDDVEILHTKGSKQMEAKFLIRMSLELPEALQLEQTSRDLEILLLVTFHGAMCYRAVPELYLPPYLEKLLDGSDSLHVPPLQDPKSIAEYVSELKQYLVDKIAVLSEGLEMRKQFVTTLLVLQYPTVLEYDVSTYRKVSLLLEHLNFRFILTFVLPINFPNQQFSMMLYSVYHMTEQGKPHCRTIENFPYSPRWKPKQMIEKALTYVFESELKKFQDLSVKNTRY